MLTKVDQWPWKPALRKGELELDGDLEAAVRYGLVGSVEELRRVSAMICVGLPDDAPCRAVWTVEGEQLKLEVKNDISAITQRFVRCDGSFAVQQDFLALEPNYWGQGHATRLLRNVLILYDELGVTEASTHANWIAGGYVWARFGARPRDAGSVRGQLGHLLGVSIRCGDIPEAYRDVAMAVINDTPEDELMQDVARLVTPEGVKVGYQLLLQLSWDAYWDGSCLKFREYMKKALQ